MAKKKKKAAKAIRNLKPAEMQFITEWCETNDIALKYYNVVYRPVDDRILLRQKKSVKIAVDPKTGDSEKISSDIPLTKEREKKVLAWLMARREMTDGYSIRILVDGTLFAEGNGEVLRVPGAEVFEAEAIPLLTKEERAALVAYHLMGDAEMLSREKHIENIQGGWSDGDYWFNLETTHQELEYADIVIRDDGKYKVPSLLAEAAEAVYKTSPYVVKEYADAQVKWAFDRLEKWKREHPLSKKQMEGFDDQDIAGVISRNSINMLREVFLKGSHTFLPPEVEENRLVFRVAGCETLCMYVSLENGKRTFIPNASAAYDRFVAAEEDSRFLWEVRGYLKEKEIQSAARLTKKEHVIYISFYIEDYVAQKELQVKKGPFKAELIKLYKEAKKEKEQNMSRLIAAYAQMPFWGWYLAEAIIATISNNPRHLTGTSITDVLRGTNLKSQEDLVLDGYSGKFALYDTSTVKDTIHMMQREGILRKYTVNGYYKNYDVYDLESCAGTFLNAWKLIPPPRARKDYTEQQYHAFLIKNKEKAGGYSKDVLVRLIGEVLDRPGIFCMDPELLMDLAERFPETAKEYIRREVKKEEGIRKKILSAMVQAANGKRKPIKPTGSEALRLIQEEQRQKEREKRERDMALEREVLTAIPDDYTKLYPLAREMHRKFILHIGPTNSGKTYDAIQELALAWNGIYLGPLRLLAFEQFEKLNRMGVPCSLVTGEEQELVAGARHQSSTVEMADTVKKYAVAVIDEAQMIADPDRGGAWTAAILGLRAERIHVCAAPEAEKRLIAMIEACGDEYEVLRHERKTPLTAQAEKFQFPKDVQKGDALIVFSRKNVHSVAAVLQERNIPCSIIYGALPYDVRHEQAALFNSGKTDVVVSTDAIGMGMNLPVKRVVFLESHKFDGVQRRMLTDGEVKQIAGRAGRYGIHEAGLMATAFKNAKFAQALEKSLPQIEKAVIGLPRALLGIHADLSEIIRKWGEVIPKEGWERASIDRMAELSAKMEKIKKDKALEYEFLMITFDEKNDSLLNIWLNMYRKTAEGEIFDVRGEASKIRVMPYMGSDYLEGLEEDHKTLDLLYGYARKFSPDNKVLSLLMRKKLEISKKILSILSDTKLEGRRCRICGRRLPWDHPYGICKKCYEGKGFWDRYY